MYKQPKVNIYSLKLEELTEVFSFCSLFDFYSISLTCRDWCEVVSASMSDNKFAKRYYGLTRDNMIPLLGPEVIYQEDDKACRQEKISKFLFNWVDIVEEKYENELWMKGFKELRKDFQISTEEQVDMEIVYRRVVRLTGEHKYRNWTAFSLILNGVRIPLFATLGKVHGEIRYLFVMAFFDEDDNITYDIENAVRTEEASFYHEFSGVDSSKYARNFKWILNSFPNYISQKRFGFELFLSVLEGYLRQMDINPLSKRHYQGKPHTSHKTDFYIIKKMDTFVSFWPLQEDQYDVISMHGRVVASIYHIKKFYDKGKTFGYT